MRENHYAISCIFLKSPTFSVYKMSITYLYRENKATLIAIIIRVLSDLQEVLFSVGNSFLSSFLLLVLLLVSDIIIIFALVTKLVKRMARTKKKTSPKVKQLVRIRFKELANGERSIYLDLYKDGKRAYEFLKDENGRPLRLLVETGTPDEVKAIKERNHKTLLQAESLRVAREKEVVELGKVETGVTKLGKMLLKDWIEQYKGLTSTVSSVSKVKQISTVVFHLKNWLGSKFDRVQMQEADTDFCRAFLKHLHGYSWKGIVAHPDKVYTLSDNSYYHIFITLRHCFDRAVREGIITVNPTDRMKETGELPKRPDVQRGFLTASEVSMLIKTECRNDTIKRAFLFGCFTGLRVSDLSDLRWEDIKQDGQDLRLQVVMQKTKSPLYMKLNRQAVQSLPDRGAAAGTDRVFSPLPTLSTIERILRQWGKDAGVEKHFTFHTSRHTFGTLTLNAGADLYTVSKLMGHKNLQTTQIYAELLNQTRDDAVDRLSDIFSEVGS